MSPVEIVKAVISALNSMGVPYMLVGSMSAMAYGLERSTKDADFVVQLGNVPLARISDFLPPDFKLESQIGFETISFTTRFRINHLPTNFMIELFEVSADEHDQSRFAGRVSTTYEGVATFLPRPEDVIITKLRWSKGGKKRLEKDVGDVRAVLAVQLPLGLDLEYIRTWTKKHGTLEQFEELLRETPRID